MRLLNFGKTTLTIILIFTTSLVLTLYFPAFAQSNNLNSVLKNAQKSLDALNNNANSSAPNKTDPSSQQPITLNSNVPNNVDMYIQTKLSYDAIDQLWYFPKDVTINFTKPNKICPDNFCKQQLDEASFNTSPPASPDEFYIYGTLKIQDQKASTDNVVAWKFYKMIGWDMKKTDIKEDIKNKRTSSIFDGILGIGTLDAINNPDISYKIIGSFQEPSGVLAITGKEKTTDAFFKERFRFNK